MTPRIAIRRPLTAAALALGLVATGAALAETPKPGGTLTVGTVYVTLSALSFDPADWNWKQNHDIGQYCEQLFAADLDKSVRQGGPHPFYADAWLPNDAIRGELAQSWEWKQNPLRVEIKLRKDAMFPEKAGVMKARALTSADVLQSYNRLDQSPKRIKGYFDHIDKVRRLIQHDRVHAEASLRRVGLPFRLGLLLLHLSQRGR